MGNALAPLTQNLYAYVSNNSINFVDPSGHYREGLTPGTEDWFDDIQYGERWTTDQIRQLQHDLNSWGFTDNNSNILSEDGVYGDNTRFAHRMYFRERQKFLESGRTIEQWEQHLAALAAGKKENSPETISNNPSTISCDSATEDEINKVLDDIESRIGLIAYIRIPLSNGGYVDVHGPHDSKTGKYHGHEYDRKGNEKGSENADGSEHDGKNFTDKTKKELKNNKVWKTIKKRNERYRKDKDRSNYRMDAGEIGASALTISVSIIGIGIIIIGIIDPIPGPI